MTDLHFIKACLDDDIVTAKLLANNIRNNYDYVMECCCIKGNIKVFEWLYSKRKIHNKINDWFQLAAINNKTNIMHFLYSTPEKNNIDDKYALELSCEKKCYNAIKLICQFNPEFSLCKH